MLGEAFESRCKVWWRGWSKRVEVRWWAEFYIHSTKQEQARARKDK
jgi:hypothetical protein